MFPLQVKISTFVFFLGAGAHYLKPSSPLRGIYPTGKKEGAGYSFFLIAPDKGCQKWKMLGYPGKIDDVEVFKDRIAPTPFFLLAFLLPGYIFFPS